MDVKDIAIKGITRIEYEDDGKTLIYGTKNSTTKISIAKMSNEEIKDELDFEKKMLQKSENDLPQMIESNKAIQNSFRASLQEKKDSEKIIESTKKNIEVLKKIIIPFYENKLNIKENIQMTNEPKFTITDVTPNMDLPKSKYTNPKFMAGQVVDIVWGEDAGKNGKIIKAIWDKKLNKYFYEIEGAGKEIVEDNLELKTETKIVESIIQTEQNKAPLEEIQLQNAQVKDLSYIPASDNCKSVDTVVPASMRYDMHKAIETIDRRVNGVDEFVAEKLGYIVGNCTMGNVKMV